MELDFIGIWGLKKVTLETFPSCTGLFYADFLIPWGPTLSPQMLEYNCGKGKGAQPWDPAPGGAEWLNPTEAEKNKWVKLLCVASINGAFIRQTRGSQGKGTEG